MKRMRIKGLLPILIVTLLCVSVGRTAPAPSTSPQTPVYVFIWFDTEDYILPEADDALLRLTTFLAAEDVRATFKIVGEKARALEEHGRSDVIQSLLRHEVGYHTNFHSVHPTIAEYLSPLGWHEGVAEFLRRETQGLEDVTRITGQKPLCYGQPGSSWGPQQYGGLLEWGVPVYLDAGEHISVDLEPFWYGGALNIYSVKHTTRAELDEPGDVDTAQRAFQAAYDDLVARGGGIVSIYYHPCEFIHEEFWDGVNFKGGANPPRAEWKKPPMKSQAQIDRAFRNFEDYVKFMKSFPEVQFVTAGDATKLYRDTAREHLFSASEIAQVAQGIREKGVYFQIVNGRPISAAEALYLLAEAESQKIDGNGQSSVRLSNRPFLGPVTSAPDFESTTTSRSQFQRTVQDVAAFMEQNHQVPDAVWIGSERVSPEAFLVSLASRWQGGADPAEVRFSPAELQSAKHVRNDKQLWGWVIFPPGFEAPEMMELARRQAWSLKPALPAWKH